MASLTSVLVLLQTVAQLLAFVVSTPGLPADFQARTLEQAVQAVAVAQEAVREAVSGEASAATPPTATSSTAEEEGVLPKPSYSLEELVALVYQGINEERRAAGLSHLWWNASAAEVAQAHTNDQAGDNLSTTLSSKPCAYPFIRHEGFASGFRVGDRLRNASVAFRTAGENIIIFPASKGLVYRYRVEEGEVVCPAFEPQPLASTMNVAEAQAIRRADVEEATRLLAGVRQVEWASRDWLTSQDVAAVAVRDWMNSPGHRANILNETFTETGIGAVSFGDYFIFTQVFLKR